MSWRTTRATALAGRAPRHVAVVDLGSNSWRLVVFSYDADPPAQWWKRTDELYETVRIGAGLAATGTLSDEAMARGLETLACSSASAAPAGSAPRTSTRSRPARSATPATASSSCARRRTRPAMTIEVLSAEDEARYGYVAAVNTTTLTDGVVLDIGGGSMQLIEVEDRREAASASFPLGAVRMTEQFLPTAIPAPGKQEGSAAPARARARGARRGRLAACAGGRAGRDRRRGPQPRRRRAARRVGATGGIDIGVQGFVITPERARELVDDAGGAAGRRARRTVPGIKPGRGDIILAAAVVLETVLELGGFDGHRGDRGRAARGRVPRAHAARRGAEPLFDDVREAAVRNLAIQYESDLPHVEHVALLSLQMLDSLVAGGLIEPQPGERELLWAARCSTTSA